MQSTMRLDQQVQLSPGSAAGNMKLDQLKLNHPEVLSPRGSTLDRRMSSSDCKDTCPLKRPTRRPSMDSTCSSSNCGAEDVAHLHEEPPTPVVSGASGVLPLQLQVDDPSCGGSSDDSGDDEATQVTSNHSSGTKKKKENKTKKNQITSSISTGHTARSSKWGEEDCDKEELEEADDLEPALPEPVDLHSKPGLIAFNDPPEDTLDDTDRPCRTLTHERIRSFMVDYYSDWDTIFQSDNKETLKECLTAFVEHYYTEELLWIRSSGNFLDGPGLIRLMSEDMEPIRAGLVSIDSIQLLAGNMAAVVVFTADQVYKYKGTPESDRATITAVMHMHNDGREGIIKIAHEHRCVGKPIPKCTRWESS